jgi:putative addiction module component (TIGR02574 family)
MATIQIEKLPVTEKIQVMESLWDSLCAYTDNISSSTWHSDVLQQREEMLNNETDSFVDWNDAKKNIRSGVDRISA